MVLLVLAALVVARSVGSGEVEIGAGANKGLELSTSTHEQTPRRLCWLEKGWARGCSGADSDSCVCISKYKQLLEYDSDSWRTGSRDRTDRQRELGGARLLYSPRA